MGVTRHKWSSSPATWARTLDHCHTNASSQIPAATGFSATYRSARYKGCSSTAKESGVCRACVTLQKLLLIRLHQLGTSMKGTWLGVTQYAQTSVVAFSFDSARYPILPVKTDNQWAPRLPGLPMNEHPASLQVLTVARMQSWCSCQLAWMPARARPVRSATAPRRPSSTSLSSNTTQPLRPSCQTRARYWHTTYIRSSTSILNAADLSVVFYADSAISVMKSSWSPLVANVAVSVGAAFGTVVVRGAWLNVLHCWWTKYYPTGRCASGHSVCYHFLQLF